jgi:hypothetical protein
VQFGNSPLLIEFRKLCDDHLAESWSDGILVVSGFGQLTQQVKQTQPNILMIWRWDPDLTEAIGVAGENRADGHAQLPRNPVGVIGTVRIERIVNDQVADVTVIWFGITDVVITRFILILSIEPAGSAAVTSTVRHDIALR